MLKILKRKKYIRKKYTVDSENLAVPEVHTGEVEPEEEKPMEEDHDTIVYDNVAIPEIHIAKHE